MWAPFSTGSETGAGASPDSPGWSAPRIASRTAFRCQTAGSGAPTASTVGPVLSTWIVVDPTRPDATPAPDTARALNVVTPSGSSPIRYEPPVTSMVPSGSEPSVVTE